MSPHEGTTRARRLERATRAGRRLSARSGPGRCGWRASSWDWAIMGSVSPESPARNRNDRSRCAGGRLTGAPRRHRPDRRNRPIPPGGWRWGPSAARPSCPYRAQSESEGQEGTLTGIRGWSPPSTPGGIPQGAGLPIRRRPAVVRPTANLARDALHLGRNSCSSSPESSVRSYRRTLAVLERRLSSEQSVTEAACSHYVEG